MVVINNMWTTIRLNLRQNRLITFKKGYVNSRKRNPLENLFLSELSGMRETKRSILKGLNTIYVTCNGSPVTGLSYIVVKTTKSLNSHYVVTI